MKSVRGFSLVELMIAITLSLIVSAAVMSVFIGARSAFQSTSGTAALSDNGRFALSFLENAVRDAGNMACGAPIRTVININAEPTPLNYTGGYASSGLFQPMSGFEAANTGIGTTYAASVTPGAINNWISPVGWPSGLDAAFSSLPTMPIINNDILVVRSSVQGGQPAYVTAVGATTLSMVSVPANWAAPQLAVISDCVKSLLFQISSVVGTTVSHNTGTSPGNITATFPGTFSFSPGSQVTLLQTTAYYIGVGADGDGALFSADLAPNNTFTANELVPNIEAMQILYGVDTTGTQTVSQYVTADQVTDFTTVMSVEIAVLAAGPPGSLTKPAAPNTYSLFGTNVTVPLDTRARQVFQVTVAARNLLP
ncbi:MAG: PilW family protein [Steroidobacteraceae bacterium]